MVKRGQPAKPRQTIIPHSRPFIDETDVAAVAEVVRSGKLAEGEQVEAFEQAQARFLHQVGGVAVTSGTAGLHLALRGLGVAPGDVVAMPSYVCSALLHAAESVGARALPIDLGPEGYNLDPTDLAQRCRGIRGRLAAIIVPHLFGAICDLGAVREATGNGIPVVEDCAQALGDKSVGAGDVLVCSFYATKMMTTGEGGMVLSRDASLLERIRDVRDYDRKPNHQRRFNYKMTEFQAALGLSQLRKMPYFLERRRALSKHYGDERRTCYRFVRSTPSLASVLRRFEAAGIQARSPVHIPIHKYLGSADADYPRTAAAMRSALSVPIYPALSESEERRIVEAIHRILR